VDVDKLSKYIKFVTKIEYKETDAEYYVKGNFRRCKAQDFRNKNYKINDSRLEENLEKRLCPDMTSLKDFLKLKNGYTNYTDRISVSFQIVKCLNGEDSTC